MKYGRGVAAGSEAHQCFIKTETPCSPIARAQASSEVRTEKSRNSSKTVLRSADISNNFP